MSAWADLAGDDSNLSMAADEFVGLKVLGDISNSASQNRSRFDPELDNSKQGLNRQLKLFGLGNDSNSNLSKKRRHSDLQTEEDDADMPPKTKQRTSGPGQNDFSRFLEPSVASAPDLSSLSSSSTNASGTTASLGSVSTPGTLENNKSKTWYSAILGKSKGRSGKKKTPQSASSHVPALVSTTSTTANPTPKSTSKTVKLGGSIPSSVRRRRMMQRRKKSASSPRKFAEPGAAGIGDPPEQREGEADDEREIEMEDVAKENIVPAESSQPRFERMDEDGGDTREALANGLKVLKTETQGRIYVPLDILESAEKRAEQPKPTPFRLMRAKSGEKSGSMSPTKLSFTEENSPPPSCNPDQSSVSSPPVVPFNMFNFMPLPIPAASFGLTTSTTVSTSGTPNNETGEGQETKVEQIPPPPFVPFAPPMLPMAGIGMPSPNADATSELNPTTNLLSPVFFNFMPLAAPLPMTAQISNGSSTTTTTALTSPPAFVPFMVPTVVQPLVAPPAATIVTPPPAVEVAQETTVDNVESAADPVTVEEDKTEAAPVAIPVTSVWAPASLSDEDEDAGGQPSWAKKCFKREVARNRVLKRREDQMKVEQRKLEMKYRMREKQLLPIEPEQRAKLDYNGSYGSNNKDNRTTRREYHPYAGDACRNNQVDRRKRGRARTRSLSEGVESPFAQRRYRRKDSTSESGTNVTSPSPAGSVSVSVEARDLPYQEPQPVTAEKIAWRITQIEKAKNTTGYKNYMAQIPKCQRKMKHPSTPNPKEKISKRRWIGKYNKWRKQLHEFDDEAKPNTAEAMDVDEAPMPETVVSEVFVPPTLADVEECPSAPQEGQQ